MNSRRVDLNDLPKYSLWPARVLGQAPWTTPSRTIEKIEQEYDTEKYGTCLEYYLAQAGQALTPEEVKRFEFGFESGKPVCISRGDELYEVSLSTARAEYCELLLKTLSSKIDNCRTVVELGCGYGYNLWMLQQRAPCKSYLGGEYSSKAVELASLLYQHDTTIRVLAFNFYDCHTYGLLDDVDPPVVVFTSHAIEQLPQAATVLDALASYRKGISAVFHFEPVFELHGETLLGLMRRRYCELNDYNRDLFSELQQRAYIRVMNAQSDVFGLNPLNPTSIVEWEFNDF